MFILTPMKARFPSRLMQQSKPPKRGAGVGHTARSLGRAIPAQSTKRLHAPRGVVWRWWLTQLRWQFLSSRSSCTWALPPQAVYIVAMAAVTFDKLAYTQLMRTGGFTPEQAETSAHALDSALRDSVATKADLDAVEARLEHKIDHSVAVLRQEIAAQRHELLKWLIPVLLGQVGLAVALMKLL